MRQEALQWHQKTERKRSVTNHHTHGGTQAAALGQNVSKPHTKTALRHAAADNRSHVDWDLMLEATWSDFDKALTRNSHVHTIRFITLLLRSECTYSLEDHYYFYAPCGFPRFPLLSLQSHCTSNIIYGWFVLNLVTLNLCVANQLSEVCIYLLVFHVF
jgi:hypothetical protein